MFNLRARYCFVTEYKFYLPSPDTTHTEDSDSIVFVVVEDPPGFPGGEKCRIKFLEDNIHYPDSAIEKGIRGTSFVAFIVEKDGSISNVRVLKGIGGGCDEEATRVIRSMPRWKPGRQRGVPVRVQCNIPIRFGLQVDIHVRVGNENNQAKELFSAPGMSASPRSREAAKLQITDNLWCNFQSWRIR